MGFEHWQLLCVAKFSGVERDGRVLEVASAPLQTSFNGFEVRELSRWMVWTSLGLCTKPGGDS